MVEQVVARHSMTTLIAILLWASGYWGGMAMVFVGLPKRAVAGKPVSVLTFGSLAVVFLAMACGVHLGGF